VNDARDYADALFPGRTWRVFGKRLKPFTLGHALILSQIGAKWFDKDQEIPEYADVLEGVLICSLSHDRAAEVVRRPLSIKTACWARCMLLRATFRPIWAFGQLRTFLRYLAAHSSSPRVASKTRNTSPGMIGPPMLALKVAAQTELGKSESEVLASSPGNLTWELMSASAIHGGVRWITEDDLELEARAAEMRRQYEMEVARGN
jgi:hypothetical protein